MNQVVLRKIAISVAAISLGCFMAVLLLCSVVLNDPVRCYADSFSASCGVEGIRISCTPLIVESIASYDGAFYEDGSGREVMGVAAIMLRNSSDETVPYANVIVYTENCRYEFEATMIPPGAAVLIPERNALILSEQKIKRCFGWMTVLQSKLPQDIKIEMSEGFTVTNQGPKTIRNLIVYHRTYIADGDFYMGGRAFETKIKRIAPAQCISVMADNFALGYSEIVWYAIQ